MEEVNEEIEMLGIFELRTLARTMGVSSPTTKKREELIKAIYDIKQGKVQPSFNKFGRPTKTHSSQNEILAKIMVSGDTELEEKIKQNGINKDSNFVLRFEQDMDESEEFASSVVMSVCGIVKKSNKGTFYFMDNSKLSQVIYVIVDDKDADRYKIIEGDMICGYANYSKKFGFARLKDIISINDCDANKNTFDLNQELVIPSVELDNDLKFGQSTLIECSDLDSAINFVKQKVENITSKNAKCVLVNLGSKIETKLKLDNISNLTSIVSTYETKASVASEKLTDCQNYVNSLLYHNNNVVLFIMNMPYMYDVLKLSGLNEEQIDYEIKKTIALCKATKNGSITVYGMYYSNQKEEYCEQIKSIRKVVLS